MPCPFCDKQLAKKILIEGKLCFFLDTADAVLVGSGMILPRAHRETLFDLTAEEWAETFSLLHEARQLLDRANKPDGYNVGWNCGPAAGQTEPHAHLHVIPRFNDEPLVGKGIRHHLKQPENRRGAR